MNSSKIQKGKMKISSRVSKDRSFAEVKKERKRFQVDKPGATDETSLSAPPPPKQSTLSS